MELRKLDNGDYNFRLDSVDCGVCYTTAYGTVFSEKVLEFLVTAYSQTKGNRPPPKTAWEIQGDLIIDKSTGAAVFSDKWGLTPLDCLCIIMNLVYDKIKTEELADTNFPSPVVSRSTKEAAHQPIY